MLLLSKTSHMGTMTNWRAVVNLSPLQRTGHSDHDVNREPLLYRSRISRLCRPSVTCQPTISLTFTWVCPTLGHASLHITHPVIIVIPGTASCFHLYKLSWIYRSARLHSHFVHQPYPAHRSRPAPGAREIAGCAHSLVWVART